MPNLTDIRGIPQIWKHKKGDRPITIPILYSFFTQKMGADRKRFIYLRLR